jgi:prepilin-type N-terminal cleavage/methylation domain-containing protein
MIYKKGFTLMETIIYIALLSIIMSGALITSYQLIDGASSADAKATIQEEGNFVMRKINWALTGLDVTSVPSIDTTVPCSHTLSVNKIVSSTVYPVNIHLSSGQIEIKENGGSYLPITTVNASTTCLKFGLTGTNPQGITATTTINGIDFAITKYIRK